MSQERDPRRLNEMIRCAGAMHSAYTAPMRELKSRLQCRGWYLD
jgi:hypothetical protein